MKLAFIIVAFFIVSSSLVITEPKKEDNPVIDKFSWLSGLWKIQNSTVPTFEQWQIKSGKLTGRSFKIVKGDTTINETLEIIQDKNKKIYYVATVKNQNQGKPVKFEFKGIEGIMYTFENPNHDFPNRIVYFREGPNLRVTLDGKDRGKHKDIIMMKAK